MARHSWSRAAVLVACVLVLVPCFWQPRIYSADLASHIYNAWLATLVERGEIQGLYLAPQRTNILFDLSLHQLRSVFGTEAAQKIAVSCAVLLLFTGSLALLNAAARRISWHLVPILAMLCHGLVYHVGLFNFYISLGFCIWSLALTWRRPPRQWLIAAPLIVAALTAHPLPVAWLAAVATYIAIARRLKARNRIMLAVSSVFIIAALRAGLQFTTATRWDLRQVFIWTGADQFLVFGPIFLIPVFFVLGFWMYLWGSLARRRSWLRILTSIPTHLAVLNAFALILIPAQLALPGYNATFKLLTDRMSLAEGILICLMLSRSPGSPARIAAVSAIAALFFGSLFVEHGKMSQLEAAIERAVATLPKHARVISGVCSEGRFNYAYHLLDRACIGHCFSYANFEPSSGQFRLRSRPGNTVVVDDFLRANEIEFKGTTVTPDDPPLFRIEGPVEGTIQVRELRTGDILPPACEPAPGAPR